MRTLNALLAASVVLSAVPAYAGQKRADISWAKAGITFENYRQDALDCANKTYGLDVSMKPETASALAALNGAELAGLISGLRGNLTSGGSEYRGGADGYFAAMSAIEPGRVLFRNSVYTETFRHAAYADVVDQLQSVLDYCLASRGYQRFRLTSEQRRQLDGYRKGSEARARFLYALAEQRANTLR